jgi:hypothetical protein
MNKSAKQQFAWIEFFQTVSLFLVFVLMQDTAFSKSLIYPASQSGFLSPWFNLVISFTLGGPCPALLQDLEERHGLGRFLPDSNDF